MCVSVRRKQANPDGIKVTTTATSGGIVYGTTMALGYARFDSYDSVGYVLTLHIFPPYSLP